MPNWGFQVSKAFEAEVDMSARQFHAVRIKSDGVMALGASAASYKLKQIGILQDAPKANEFGEVCIFGLSKAVVDGAAGAVSVGSWLYSGSDGQLLPVSTATCPCIAIALEAATVADAVIKVIVIPGISYP